MIDRPALIFDLDGTLTDSYAGIAASFAHALAALDLPEPANFRYRSLIGPGIQESFARLFGDDPGVAARALVAYRERYATIGLFENTVYDGIESLLQRLEPAFNLFVCTAKPLVFAERILVRFDLRRRFRAVYGSELDGRFTDKRELLARLLERERIAAARAVMVGDRRQDIAAARFNGTAAIGVRWGYADPGELEAAGCTIFADRPAEVEGIVAGLGRWST